MSANATLILSEVQGLRAEILSLKAQVTTLQSALASKPVSAAPVKGVRAKKEKDPDAPKRAPSAWILFTKRVHDLLAENSYTGSDLGKNNQMFCGSLKDENSELSSWKDEDILARRAAWAVPEISKQKASGKSYRKNKEGSTASVASAPAEDELEDAASAAPSEESKKRGPAKGTKLTEEQKAQRKATREANKAKKAAAEGFSAGRLDDEPLGASAEEIQEAVKAAAAVKKAAPAPAPAPAPVAVKTEAADEFKPVLLNKKRYLVNLATGHAYNRNEDGSQSTWAGIFSKKMQHPDGKIAPGIDFTVPEPGAEEAEEEELEFGSE